LSEFFAERGFWRRVHLSRKEGYQQRSVKKNKTYLIQPDLKLLHKPLTPSPNTKVCKTQNAKDGQFNKII